jgi:UDP-N-acetylglucosamine:LPS N-acetylglucosamine transferase
MSSMVWYTEVPPGRAFEAISQSVSSHEADLTPEALAGRLAICLSEPERLTEMARRASELGRPEATSALADALESLIARTPAKAYREALA